MLINDSIESFMNQYLQLDWTFVRWLPHKYINLLSSQIMLNRFCSEILPDIHQNIQCLDLESSPMKDVLCTANYPNLHTLGLYNINEQSVRSLFTGKISTTFLKLIDIDE